MSFDHWLKKPQTINSDKSTIRKTRWNKIGSFACWMANAFRINLWINLQIKLQEVYFQTNVRAHAYAFVLWKIHIYGCRVDIECTRSSNQDHEFLTRSCNSNRDKAEHCFYDYSQFSITFAFHGREFGTKKYIQNYRRKGKSEIQN